MKTAPGFSQWIPLPFGEFGAILRDPLGFQLRAQERLGDVVRFRNGPFLIHLLYHPDHVGMVLQDRQRIYLRSWQYRLLRRLFGENLVTSEGDFWKRARRLAQPAFHHDRLAGHVGVMVDVVAKTVVRWQNMAGTGCPVDVGREMSLLALAVAGRTLFNRDVSDQADDVGRAFGVVGNYLERRFNNVFSTPPLWMPTPGNAQFKRARRTLNEIVRSMIRERRLDGADHGDLLSMLIQVRDEDTGEQMADEQIRSEALTFLIAGHETTATALTWACHLLSTHTDVQQRVREEVRSVLEGRPPTLADLPRLTLTRMVIEESMRLYPPIWAITRQATVDDDLDGFHIPARSMVVLSPYVTHRHPEFWTEPDRFDPERFRSDRVAARPKGAYFPFLVGPHQCIGNEFAMLEMRLVIAMILQALDLEPMEDTTIRPQTSLTLRPDRPVHIRLRLRAR